MANAPRISLSRLDALIASAGFPVRAETLEQAWTLAVESPASTRFHDRTRRILEGRAAAAGEVTILVTLRAKPEAVGELEAAAMAFVESGRQLPGALSSTLYRSTTDRRTLLLLERFVDQEAFSRHMASDYFRRFQLAQARLLAQPVEAVFLEPVSE